MFEIRHIKTPTATDPHWVERVYKFCRDNITPETSSLWQNYMPERLHVEDHIIFSVLTEKDEILAFCGIYRNPNHYPPGVFRILNRMFVHPRFRKNSLLSRAPRFLSFEIAKRQLDQVAQSLDLVFVSFEKRSRIKSFSAVAHNLKHDSIRRWRFESDFFRVAPGYDKPCHQVVMWSNITGNYSNFPFERISPQEWGNL
jgi:hypothetical protein